MNKKIICKIFQRKFIKIMKSSIQRPNHISIIYVGTINEKDRGER